MEYRLLLYRSFAMEIGEENCQFLDIETAYTMENPRVRGTRINYIQFHNKFRTISYIKSFIFLWKNRKDTIAMFHGIWPRLMLLSFIPFKHKCLWKHTILGEFNSSSFWRIFDWISKWGVIKLFQNRFETIFYVNEAERSEHVRMGYRGQLYFLPIPIDFEKFDSQHSADFKQELEKKYNKKDNDKWIVCVAGIHPIKNIESIIDAAMKIVIQWGDRNCFFHIIWHDHYPELWKVSLFEQINSLGLSNNFIFHWMQNQEYVSEILSITDVYLQPSYREWQSKSVTEAAIKRVPMCLSNILTFTQTYAGMALFHNHNDIAAFVHNIKFILNNPGLAEEMANQAYAAIKNRYSVSAFETQAKTFIDSLKSK